VGVAGFEPERDRVMDAEYVYVPVVVDVCVSVPDTVCVGVREGVIEGL
jgi:hypothetical protein